MYGEETEKITKFVIFVMVRASFLQNFFLCRTLSSTQGIAYQKESDLSRENERFSELFFQKEKNSPMKNRKCLFFPVKYSLFNQISGIGTTVLLAHLFAHDGGILCVGRIAHQE